MKVCYGQHDCEKIVIVLTPNAKVKIINLTNKTYVLKCDLVLVFTEDCLTVYQDGQACNISQPFWHRFLV